MGIGKAFGKTILIGDSFVLNEVPAIVCSIPFVTETTVERIKGRGWILEDNRIEVPGYKAKKEEMHLASIERILDVMKIDLSDKAIKITLAGDLLAGSGVGASAASCVSLARALDEEFDLHYTIEQINHVGWEGEFPYHGHPSGVDNTASTYGGILYYYIQNNKKGFEKITVQKPIHLVLANSGITADTRMLGKHVDALKEERKIWFEEKLAKIRVQVAEMRKCLEQHELQRVGEIMTENHEILIEMGISHPKLIEMCEKARSWGAYGAKLTGGGMGGYISAIVPNQELQEEIATQFEKQDYKVIRTSIQ